MISGGCGLLRTRSRAAKPEESGTMAARKKTTKKKAGKRLEAKADPNKPPRKERDPTKTALPLIIKQFTAQQLQGFLLLRGTLTLRECLAPKAFSNRDNKAAARARLAKVCLAAVEVERDRWVNKGGAKFRKFEAMLDAEAEEERSDEVEEEEEEEEEFDGLEAEEEDADAEEDEEEEDVEEEEEEEETPKKKGKGKKGKGKKGKGKKKKEVEEEEWEEEDEDFS